jgi:hypothetical protein
MESNATKQRRSPTGSAAQSCAPHARNLLLRVHFNFLDAFEEEMKFGPAEMAQTMEAAKALITVSMISFVGIGLVLGVIVALFVAFFQRGLHRNRAEPLTNGPLLTPNSSPGSNTVYPGRPPSMCDQLAREHTSIGNDITADRINRSDERIFPFRLSILLLIVVFGGGVLYGQYAWQRSDTPPKPEAPQRADTPQRPDLLLRAGYTEIYSILGISPLPEAVETNASIRRGLYIRPRRSPPSRKSVQTRWQYSAAPIGSAL